MNQHVIDLYKRLRAKGLTNDQIIMMCEHFNTKLLREYRETYADMLIYAKEIATTNHHPTTTNHQPPTTNY